MSRAELDILHFVTDICRICGSKEAVFINLLQPEYMCYLDLVKKFLNIEIKFGGLLPKTVCHLCITILYNFQKLINDSKPIQVLLNDKITQLQEKNVEELYNNGDIITNGKTITELRKYKAAAKCTNLRGSVDSSTHQKMLKKVTTKPNNSVRCKKARCSSVQNENHIRCCDLINKIVDQSFQRRPIKLVKSSHKNVIMNPLGSQFQKRHPECKKKKNDILTVNTNKIAKNGSQVCVEAQSSESGSESIRRNPDNGQSLNITVCDSSTKTYYDDLTVHVKEVELQHSLESSKPDDVSNSSCVEQMAPLVNQPCETVEHPQASTTGNLCYKKQCKTFTEITKKVLPSSMKQNKSVVSKGRKLNCWKPKQVNAQIHKSVIDFLKRHKRVPTLKCTSVHDLTQCLKPAVQEILQPSFKLPETVNEAQSSNAGPHKYRENKKSIPSEQLSTDIPSELLDRLRSSKAINIDNDRCLKESTLPFSNNVEIEDDIKVEIEKDIACERSSCIEKTPLVSVPKLVNREHYQQLTVLSKLGSNKNDNSLSRNSNSFENTSKNEENEESSSKNEQWFITKIPGNGTTLYVCPDCNSILLSETAKKQHVCDRKSPSKKLKYSDDSSYVDELDFQSSLNKKMKNC